ncbi:VOC family protein [Streptomyces sp. NPDC048650]|uniref:VOC family protein n=1 Tax=unclassified Streptomyces TaxID=2593676 RepID=UPI0037224C87
MPSLDHTIVHSTDRFASARFLAGLLDAPEPKEFGPFAAVAMDNGVTLDYAEELVPDKEFVPTHYAFLVTEAEFDAIFARIEERGLPYWADPRHTQAQQLNTRDGGRGLYLDDPDGHNLEFLTRTYSDELLAGL